MKSHFKLLLVVYVVLCLQHQHRVLGDPQVPCMFIFGDSLSDNGNNNLLPTQAKVNYNPYGIDFSQGPTGRFTNGRNLPDFIAEFLGFDDYIPPYLSATSSNILQGINYASGGAGIRFETGRALGVIISFDEQLKRHSHVVSQINSLLGDNNAAAAHLKSCLYMVEFGSNDYLNNYFLPLFYQSSRQFTPEAYAVALNNQLSSQLKSLYDQGARKLAVFGVGILGCTPYAKANFDTKGAPCVDEINNSVQLFNTGLKSLVQDLNTNFPDAKFTFIDVFKISTLDPSSQGGLVLDTPCCEVQSVQCVPFGKVCANRSQYIFWDGVHPTEIGFMSLASRAFKAQRPDDAYPYDISHLAQL